MIRYCSFVVLFSLSFNQYFLVPQRPISKLLKWEEISSESILIPKSGPVIVQKNFSYYTNFYKPHNYEHEILSKEIFIESGINKDGDLRLRLFGLAGIKLKDNLIIQNEFEFDNNGKEDLNFSGVERGMKNGWVGYLQHSTLTYSYDLGYLSVGKGNPYLFNLNESLLINYKIPPIKFAWWQHAIDWLQYDWVFGLLNKSEFTEKNRFFIYHRYSINKNNFRIGFSEAVLSAYEDWGAREMEYLLPSNLLLETEANGTFNTNLIWLIDVMYKVNKYTLYSEIMIDDFAIDGKTPPQIAGIIGLGAKYNKLLFNIEYTRINRWVGNHCDQKNIFIDNNIPIGNSIGPNAHKILIDSKFLLNDKISINILFDYVEHADGSPYNRLVESWPVGIGCDENFGYDHERFFLKDKNTDFYYHSKLIYRIKNNILMNLLINNQTEYFFNITLRI